MTLLGDCAAHGGRQWQASQAVGDGQPVEVVIKRFTFTPEADLH